MRDLPSGAALLALAREVLIEELLPLLPDEAGIRARLVATCMAIAEREARAGEGPIAETALRVFYQGSLQPGESPLHRFAQDLRKGALETSGSQEAAARAILWRLTIAKLREGHPGFLAAHDIAGS